MTINTHFLSQAMLDGLRAVVRSDGRMSWNVIGASFDPDWLATSLVVQRILDHLGRGAHLVCGRKSGHAQSRMLWDLFDLHAQVRTITEMDDTMPSALVDSSEMQDARFGEEVVINDPLIMIDHHEGAVRLMDGAFFYVEQTGACASLALNLALSLGVPIDPRTAAVVAVGIYTDTEELFPGITTPLDHDMFWWARTHGDNKLFNAVAARPHTASQRFLLKRIYANTQRVGPAFLAHPGQDLHAGEGEMLGEAARYLARQDRIRLALTWGIEDDSLRVSVRTRDPNLALEPFLRGMFGHYCGARSCIGGATVPLGEAVRTMDPHKRIEAINGMIATNVLAATL